MSAILDLVLGVVTSIGGFVEVGSLSTSAQAGAEFRFQLLWAILVAAFMLAMLSEMAGRFAVVSQRSLIAAVRERFGIDFQVAPLAAELVIDILLLAAELGGAAIAVRMLTGVTFVWWILPIGVVVWLVLWFSGFKVIEDGIGVLGLVTLAFVVAAWKLGPPMQEVGKGFVPSLPGHDRTRYAFLAVSIMGATVSPYLLNFYSSGTIEEKLTVSKLWINRATSYAGILFGSGVTMGVVVVAALVLEPRHILVNSYDQAALMLVPAFDRWAIPLFASALGIGCFGAAVEITINAGYACSQAFGWPWGADKPRRQVKRFVVAFTIVLLLALVVALSGVDPLRLTMISVALTVVLMPAVVLPFLVLMNDKTFVKEHTSGPIGNALLAAVTIFAALMAAVVIPLEILGG